MGGTPYLRKITTRNALGKQTLYTFEYFKGSWLIKPVEGVAAGSCLAANKNTTYDANGFTDTQTDWEGHVTDWDFNDYGKLTRLIEAKGTAAQRITNYEYHPANEKPTKITTTLVEKTFTYDDFGRRASKTLKNLTAYGVVVMIS